VTRTELTPPSSPTLNSMASPSPLNTSAIDPRPPPLIRAIGPRGRPNPTGSDPEVSIAVRWMATGLRLTRLTNQFALITLIPARRRPELITPRNLNKKTSASIPRAARAMADLKAREKVRPSSTEAALEDTTTPTLAPRSALQQDARVPQRRSSGSVPRTSLRPRLSSSRVGLRPLMAGLTSHRKRHRRAHSQARLLLKPLDAEVGSLSPKGVDPPT
jgi:hypothetical protein